MPSSERRAGCWGTFWGPLCPAFGGVTLLEAGASYWVPTKLLFTTRFASFIFIWTTFIYYVATGVLRFQFYTVWSYLLLAISFTFLASSSLCQLIFSRGNKRLWCRTLSAFTAAFSQLAFSAGVYLLPIYWGFLYDRTEPLAFSNIVVHALNVVWCAIDLLLGSRIRGRLSYAGLFVAYALIYLVFVWIYYAATREFPYNILDFRNKSAGLTVGIYLGLVVWGLVNAVLVLVLYKTFESIARCTGRAGHGDSEQLPR